MTNHQPYVLLHVEMESRRLKEVEQRRFRAAYINMIF